VNEESHALVGSVHPTEPGSDSTTFRVVAEEGETVATVTTVKEAVPVLAAHYEANPPQWEPEEAGTSVASEADAPERLGPRYIKRDQFGILWVDQIVSGQWIVYRDDHELLINEGIAIFNTCEEAQRAADLHVRDGYPNSEAIDDGLSWLPDPSIAWWGCSDTVVARARQSVFWLNGKPVAPFEFEQKCKSAANPTD
jgi:hypothetical protein